MRVATVFLLAVLGMIVALTLNPTGASAADLDCGDFSSQAEAQENLLSGDPYGLDGDSDGIACEDLPCPCSTSSGSGSGNGEPSPPPPPKLDKAAARQAAERKARKFTRRRSTLDSVALRGCGRRDRQKIVCRFLASGQNQSRRTTCRFRVVAHGEGTDVSTRIRGARCRSRLLVVLSRARAKQAMKAAAQQVAKMPVIVYALSRQGPRSFTGLAEWTQTSAAKVEELCSLELTAELPRSGSIQVRTHNLDCQRV